MTIPSFDGRGLLPPFVGSDATTPMRSPYLTTVPDLTAHLGSTDERKTLIRHLISYRTLLASDGYITGIQFIDGSFVENIESSRNRPPSDIDVFSILNAPTKYHSDPNLWSCSGRPFWEGEIADREKNKSRFNLDTYAILYEEMTPTTFIQQIIYWYGLFSHQRESFAWKGFVALPLDSAADQAALIALGG